MIWLPSIHGDVLSHDRTVCCLFLSDQGLPGRILWFHQTSSIGLIKVKNPLQQKRAKTGLMLLEVACAISDSLGLQPGLPMYLQSSISTGFSVNAILLSIPSCCAIADFEGLQPHSSNTKKGMVR